MENDSTKLKMNLGVLFHNLVDLRLALLVQGESNPVGIIGADIIGCFCTYLATRVPPQEFAKAIDEAHELFTDDLLNSFTARMETNMLGQLSALPLHAQKTPDDLEACLSNATLLRLVAIRIGSSLRENLDTEIALDFTKTVVITRKQFLLYIRDLVSPEEKAAALDKTEKALKNSELEDEFEVVKSALLA